MGEIVSIHPMLRDLLVDADSAEKTPGQVSVSVEEWVIFDPLVGQLSSAGISIHLKKEGAQRFAQQYPFLVHGKKIAALMPCPLTDIRSGFHNGMAGQRALLDAFYADGWLSGVSRAYLMDRSSSPVKALICAAKKGIFGVRHRGCDINARRADMECAFAEDLRGGSQRPVVAGGGLAAPEIIHYHHT